MRTILIWDRQKAAVAFVFGIWLIGYMQGRADGKFQGALALLNGRKIDSKA